MPLDEKALRKPTFVEGVRLRLADGQDWTVPKPRFWLYPRFDESGNVSIGSKLSFGADLDYIIDEMGAEASDPHEGLKRRFAVMVKLLQANYNLTAADLGDLLKMNRLDPESAAVWEPIDRLLTGQPIDSDEGQPPKPSADGSV